jgi:hypothetical protein
MPVPTLERNEAEPNNRTLPSGNLISPKSYLKRLKSSERVASSILTSQAGTIGTRHPSDEILVKEENCNWLVTDNGMLSVAADACHFVRIKAQAN